jgi:hypothetical protein
VCVCVCVLHYYIRRRLRARQRDRVRERAPRLSFIDQQKAMIDEVLQEAREAMQVIPVILIHQHHLLPHSGKHASNSKSAHPIV